MHMECNDNRVIFHVDVNSAFLSWEAVYRLKQGETVDLREIPSAVGGDVKKRQGIISARSLPAKKKGVQSGEPVVKALQKCPELVVVPGNYHLYDEYSRQFISLCETYTDKLEQFSVDECFMDVTTLLKPGDRDGAVQLANELRESIYEKLGFTVNIGVSQNKLLAKMASDFKKPNLVHTLWQDEIEKKMWPLPVGDLLFVGKKSEQRLKELGIHTIGDIIPMPLEILKLHLGEKGGMGTYDSARGIDDSPVVSTYEGAKCYGNSMTLPKNTNNRELALRYLLFMVESSSRRMRKDGKKAGVVTVTYRNSGFENFSHQRKLDYHTSSSTLLYQEAETLFDELWNTKDDIRLVGISLSNLSDGSNEQMSLFTNANKEKEEKLDAMLDAIKDRFGEKSIRRSGEMLLDESKERG